MQFCESDVTKGTGEIALKENACSRMPVQLCNALRPEASLTSTDSRRQRPSDRPLKRVSWMQGGQKTGVESEGWLEGKKREKKVCRGYAEVLPRAKSG